MSGSIELDAQWRDASFRTSAFDDSDNSVGVTWASGAPVTRKGPNGYYDEVLVMEHGAVRLDRLNTGAPLLNSHRDDRLEHVLGNVLPGSARIEGGKGIARVRLSTAPADADNVEKIRTGIVRACSVGYRVHKIEIVERDGDIPIWRVTDWTPMELSAVPVGADMHAQFHSGTRAAVERNVAQVVTRPSAGARAKVDASRYVGEVGWFSPFDGAK